jgi:hypothetical protein
MHIELGNGLKFGALSRYSPWISVGCSNLGAAVKNYGKVLCLSSQGYFTGTPVSGASAPMGRRGG